MDGYCNLLQKTGDASFGDKVETIFFNAAQGARHPSKSCISYCKTDNSYEMTGTKNGEPVGTEKQTRFKYSPAHQDVAVCCVPNAGRISPYFVKSLWMKDKDGLVATLLSPCELKTKWKGKEINITEETNYPFENTINFIVKTSGESDFSLKIRKPEWVKDFTINCDYKIEGQYIVINKSWKSEETISIELKAEVEIKQLANGQKYYKYSALVFALPFESDEIITKTFAIDGFADYQYNTKNNEAYKFIDECKPEVLLNAEKPSQTIWESVEIKTELLNLKTNKPETVKLFPIGATILRQVTFEH